MQLFIWFSSLNVMLSLLNQTRNELKLLKTSDVSGSILPPPSANEKEPSPRLKGTVTEFKAHLH